MANGVILVFDITNEKSFKNITYWLEKVNSNANIEIMKVLVGNKADLQDKRQVSSDEAIELAFQH